VVKPEGKRALERPRRRWEDNLNKDLRDILSGGRESMWLRTGTDNGLLCIR
jgi:hypothetical protein